MRGPYRLMADLLYGSGLRLLECLRLRVKDVDFHYLQITLLVQFFTACGLDTGYTLEESTNCIDEISKTGLEHSLRET